MSKKITMLHSYAVRIKSTLEYDLLIIRLSACFFGPPLTQHCEHRWSTAAREIIIIRIEYMDQ